MGKVREKAKSNLDSEYALGLRFDSDLKVDKEAKAVLCFWIWIESHFSAHSESRFYLVSI